MRTRLALLLIAAALAGVVGFLTVFVSGLQRADDRALSARLSVVAQDVRETIEARARLGLKLRYMTDLQPMIERERAASPGLATITVRGESHVVLFSTDRVTVGEEAHWDVPTAGSTRVGAHLVVVGLPVLNSFAEQLGDVEVSAQRSGLDLVHMQPLTWLLGVAAVFLLLAAALAWLGSAALLHRVQLAVAAATLDAGRALTLIHRSADAHGRESLLSASRDVLGLIRETSEDIRRLDEAES